MFQLPFILPNCTFKATLSINKINMLLNFSSFPHQTLLLSYHRPPGSQNPSPCSCAPYKIQCNRPAQALKPGRPRSDRPRRGEDGAGGTQARTIMWPFSFPGGFWWAGKIICGAVACRGWGFKRGCIKHVCDGLWLEDEAMLLWWEVDGERRRAAPQL